MVDADDAVLEKGNRKEAEAAKESLERLAEQGYGDSGEKAREAGAKIANLSNRRKKIAVAAVAGIILLAVMVAISPLPSMLEARADMKAEQEVIDSKSIGQTVEFGTYSEDLSTYKGTSVAGRPIRWIVVDKEDGRALLVTQKCIDEMAFDTQGDATDFKSSSLYDYLSGSFRDFASSDVERGLIDGDITILNTSLLCEPALSDDFRYAESVKDDKVKDWWTSTVEKYGGSSGYRDFYYVGQPLVSITCARGAISNLAMTGASRMTCSESVPPSGSN